MDNFNLRKYLAEGKLNENMFDVDTTEKIAQAIADAFTADDELDLKYVVNPRIDAGHFDLDVEAGFNTPDQDSLGQDIDNYLGEFAGGSFYIKNGVVYNAAMRNAPVANVTPEGEVEMISAEDSRAALGMDENKEETKTNKMKKSELKEMIKSAFLNEKETFDQAFDRIDKEEDVYPGEKPVKEAEEEDVEDIEVDVDAEDVNVDTETGEVGAEAPVTPEMGSDAKEVQDSLEAALAAAKAMGDQKLVDQIGNSITFFTRTHVVGKEQTPMEEAEDTVTVNEVEFPMWTKIKK